MGYPTALTAPTWGFQERCSTDSHCGSPGLESYVIENILFKVDYPAEFHAQTAAEAAISLHPLVRDRLAQVDRVGRDPAVGHADHQQDGPAPQSGRPRPLPAIRGGRRTDPWHARRRALPGPGRRGSSHRPPSREIAVRENPRYSRDYLDPQMRSIANAVQVFFADGSRTERVEIEYPLGHRRRRAEATASLWRKFEASLTASLSTEKCHALLDLFRAPDRLRTTSVPDFLTLLTVTDRPKTHGNLRGISARHDTNRLAPPPFRRTG